MPEGYRAGKQCPGGRAGAVQCHPHWTCPPYMVERAASEPSRTAKPPLTLLIAAPRGFCAGVDRAIRIVELALERYGAPVYVRHEIVHNKFVVDSLKAKGAVFVRELDEVPDGVPVVFSP